jgi:predicted ATPase/transcriptional regulator with XRE-family HTH domain
MLEQQSFGYWLRLKRKALDLTREGLADQVGCSAATIRKIEAEERHPSVQIAERLAEILEIPRNERSAFLRFARGDWQSGLTEIKEDLPWRTSTKSPPSNLPAAATSLVGRVQEIAEIWDQLRTPDVRLVTLVGPPGIGKTRLSVEAAHAALTDFPDGVFFVALAPLDDPNLIATVTAQALGYVGTKNVSTLEQLKEGIRDKRLLLVLDNCEHLIEAVASIVSELLAACPRLKILTTSRESLRIAGEWLYPVPAFDLPSEISSMDIETASQLPALTLFAERARAVRPNFAIDSENINTVFTICAHLDGLPLAIELIAARMRLMSPQALLERLNVQFIMAADGMRAASMRQKTLSDAIRWSYDLLSREEQKIFARLSVFSGGFTLDLAEAFFSDTVEGKSVAELVTLLLDKSLLARTLDERGELVFSMLVTIQEFARERLRDMGEEAALRDLHLAYFSKLAEQADQELHGPNPLEMLHRLDLMRDNLRAALEWALETGQTETALRLARDLDWFWFFRGDYTEGRQWLGRVLALGDGPLYPALYTETLTKMAHQTWVQIGAAAARPYVERALTMAREHNDKHNLARALDYLGLVLAYEYHFPEAKSALEESRMLFQEVQDEWGYAHALIALGQVVYNQEDWTTTAVLSEDALARFREIGERCFEIVALRFLGIARVKLGQLREGMAALRDALLLAQKLGSKYEIAVVLHRYAEAAQFTHNPLRAVRLYYAARSILDLIGAWTSGADHESETERNLKTCRSVLDEAAFATAAEEGRAMTVEQAIGYALEQE